jgi:hypothetical protein
MAIVDRFEASARRRNVVRRPDAPAGRRAPARVFRKRIAGYAAAPTAELCVELIGVPDLAAAG